ncbi:radical SAM family heme chaperone HemW [Heliophilum fasciatum]|uniref:Heme chaperone HemW n=1 Tax=Heliophilum fasciatum TaxID=35700 RepID=A0A4V2SX06_9FIRM|nr:radical SAM family heme chaperone HemW [Heliophilum fasciatum]MCW2278126.1 oxygen-independent coproporphyrinogen-3 oxidase [Heliophilum fasciatum]TCP64196.1 oxygen-independent coproporphyrinogen-3 oxidase [Heliophilum fasciatum]
MNNLAPLRLGWTIYVHVPFCVAKCSYCDFYSHRADPAERLAYGEALRRHLAALPADPGGDGRPPASLFFGGGTPSLLPPSMLVGLVGTVAERFGMPAEVTVEANPGTVSPDDLATWVAGGIRRLSFGAQAFQGRLLHLLGRCHDQAAIGQAVAMAQQAGIEDINLDLIYGIPGQTLEDWRESLQAAVALAPTHLSLYNLKLEVGTPLERQAAAGHVALCPEEDEVAMYEWACAYLAAHGFDQYELSNFARPGYQCRHNLNYWRRGDYLGIGSGAASNWGHYRWTWCLDSRRYSQAWQQGEACALPSMLGGGSNDNVLRSSGGAERPAGVGPAQTVEMIDDFEALAPEVAAGEAIFLGLRRMVGVDLTAVAAEYQVVPSVLTRWQREAEKLRQQGWVTWDGRHLTLTPKAYLLSNEIMERFLP